MVRNTKAALGAVYLLALSFTAVAQNYEAGTGNSVDPNLNSQLQVVVGNYNNLTNSPEKSEASTNTSQSTIVGSMNNGTGSDQIFGVFNTTDSGIAGHSLAVGSGNTGADYTVNVGNSNVGGSYSTNVGNYNLGGVNSFAGGYGNTSGDYGTTWGQYNYAGIQGVAGGYSNYAADGGVAMGLYNIAGSRCAAIGLFAECYEDGVATFGNAETPARIINVANGLSPNDAVNYSQLSGVAGALGGGAGFDTYGIFDPPRYYYISGAVYTTVADGLYDLDSRVYALESNPSTGDGTSVPGPQGPQGEPGQDGTDGAANVAGGKNITVTQDGDTATVALADNVALSNQGSVTVGATTVNNSGLTIQGGPSVTSTGVDAGNRRVTSVADGRVEQGSTDAVNGGQLWAAEDSWDRRFEKQDRRIDALGAQSAALTMATASMLPAEVGEVQLGAGTGFYGTEVAVSAVMKARVSERVSVTGGLSLSGRGRAMGGLGVSISLGR